MRSLPHYRGAFAPRNHFRGCTSFVSLIAQSVVGSSKTIHDRPELMQAHLVIFFRSAFWRTPQLDFFVIRICTSLDFVIGYLGNLELRLGKMSENEGEIGRFGRE